MKKNWMIVVLLSIFMISACVPLPSAPSVDYPATIAALSVEATVGSIEKASMVATLAAYANQPTATCPACPTPALPTATFTPAATATPTQPIAANTNTPRPFGGVSGALSYPSSHIPPLRVIAFNIATGEYYWQNTILDQGSYRFNDLPVGVYHLLAYLIDNPTDDFIAGYSKAVPCGLSVDCNDHSLIDVTVTQGKEVQNVDVTDWYFTEPTKNGWPEDPTIN